MREWFQHAIQLTEKGGGVLPLRFTDAQLEFFKKRPHLFRCYNSAGIKLELLTDSPSVSMLYHVSLKPGTTEQLYFDLYVDDVLIGFEGDTFTEEGTGEWSASLPIEAGRPCKLTIYFPYLASVTVQTLTFGEGSVCEPAPSYEQNLLMFGDSITQGLNAVHPSQTYAVQVARGLRMNLLNQAVSGFVFHPDLIDPQLPYRPDLVTVAYGTNDWALCETPEQFEEQAGAFIGKLARLYRDVPVVVISPIWRSDLTDPKPAGAFTDIHRTLERISERENVRYLDGLALTPHHNDYFADGLHPNDLGFMHMTLELLKRLPR
ncbi:SGNH/GDSL hydrolase family protein [Paenibacillus aurantius]|uniref:SGNH/GDSL hydrolase family protein n=1 Tax=Paenibacillus aurantius TaxID=2918900 RepID=A0AA96LHT9_9BACL|nr:SGNH/GDSL hydrolase family protein [Paenibacillus aurantius]WNQ13583.1 SGNH/GDSL hydrolase family protein [Paenibacillus aurantius]